LQISNKYQKGVTFWPTLYTHAQRAQRHADIVRSVSNSVQYAERVASE